MTTKQVLAIVAVLAAFAALLAWLVPASRSGFGIAAAAFALATWTLPALRFALAKQPKTSLASVGLVIHVVALAALFSAAGLWLAALALVFADNSAWAWRAILAVIVFWPTACLVTMLSGRRPPRTDERR